ncbi:hypothetical protein TNCV_651421 [Trichonephila clavipes]|nr:hypothetical protein TNCV_651421 [Trichonephila clavipes]
MKCEKRSYPGSQRDEPRFRQGPRNSGNYTNFHEQRPPIASTVGVASTYLISWIWGQSGASDSDYENEMDYTAPVPTSSKMKNITNSTRSYLDTHSNREMNNKMEDIELFVDSQYGDKNDSPKKNIRQIHTSESRQHENDKLLDNMDSKPRNDGFDHGENRVNSSRQEDYGFNEQKSQTNARINIHQLIASITQNTLFFYYMSF